MNQEGVIFLMKNKILASLASIVLINVLFAAMAMTRPGPAPSSGDGVPEGPEWGLDRPDGEGVGPAPNSGDGVPDGPGW